MEETTSHLQEFSTSLSKQQQIFCPDTFKISDISSNMCAVKMFEAICLICEESITNCTSLREHVQNTHMKDGKYVCIKCNKLLKTKRNILRHINEVHKGVSRYKAVKEKRFHVSPSFPRKGVYKGKGKDQKGQRIKSTSGSELGAIASEISSSEFVQSEAQTSVQTFVCGTCEVYFPCKEDLQEHISSHCDFFECHKCKQRFGNKTKRDQHLKDNCERLSKFHSCYQCKKIFKFDFDLQRHKDTMHCTTQVVRGACDEHTASDSEITHRTVDINANIDNTSFPSTESKQDIGSEQHKLCANNSDNGLSETGCKKLHYCGVCRKTFGTKYELVKHKTIHRSFKRRHVYKCKVCGVKMLSRKQLWRHQFIHTDQGGYKCPICGYNFKTAYHLRRHLQVHERNFSKYCNLCQRIFTNDDRFQSHLKICEIQKAELNSCTKPSERDSILQEKKCSANHESLKTMKTELNDQRVGTSYHKTTESTCTDAEDRVDIMLDLGPSQKYGFSCELCGKIFKLESNFQDHKNIHRDHLCFTCSECGEKFKTKTQLRSHSCSKICSIQPQKTKNTCQVFTCNICSRCFRSQLSLSLHSVTHRDHLFYRCNVCSHGFSTRTKLNAHKVTHTDTTAVDTVKTPESQQTDRYSDDDTHNKFKKHICVICKKNMMELDSSWEADHTHVMVMMQ